MWQTEKERERDREGDAWLQKWKMYMWQSSDITCTAYSTLVLLDFSVVFIHHNILLKKQENWKGFYGREINCSLSAGLLKKPVISSFLQPLLANQPPSL